MAADFCEDSAQDIFHIRMPSHRAGKGFCKPRCQYRQHGQLGASDCWEQFFLNQELGPFLRWHPVCLSVPQGKRIVMWMT